MSDELKECPFCDGPAREYSLPLGYQTYYLVCCSFDDCAGSYDIGSDGSNGYISREFARDEWNTRA